ncbi:MAG: cardiolipin synthase [Deltaproteobacteria bacterium]|nr:cardiolipin synthase [Deltaproteobacteria bacterium]
MSSISALIDVFKKFWPHIVTAVTFGIMIWTAGHVLLRKRDTKAATGWIGLILFSPPLGVCLYWLFGINRIQRRARIRLAGKEIASLPELHGVISPAQVEERLGEKHFTGLVMLCRLTEKVTRQPLMDGNQIVPLVNGDEAFPAMLAAIREARSSISLVTYIFDNDAWGKKFRQELCGAVQRGVAVRVLIDDVGARYSFPSIVGGLRRDGVQVARFMRTLLPWRFQYNNLRNHRKILVVDGRLGFTGGMNITAGNVLANKSARTVQDVHFLIQGPVVAELQNAFAEDWAFTTEEKLAGSDYFPRLDYCGNRIARGISDGPDEDFDRLRLITLGALAAARSSIRIATPYFLPDNELVAGLRIAALRGVAVEILVPSISNLRMIKWASTAGLTEIVASGCRVFFTEPPFDHSKIVVVDNGWVLLGSANWDPRSFNLNFEFNIECYDTRLAATMNELLDSKLTGAQQVTRESLENRFYLKRLRDNFFRLFSPYF